jgi:hypothetical protein
VEWGFKYTREDIRDRVVEWEVIDSAGFSINPPHLNLPINDQPYHPYIGPLVPFQNVRALNFATVDRLSGYAQLNRKTKIGNHDFWFNVGARMHHWKVNSASQVGKSQMEFSPRAQFAIKPDWEKDIVFRFSTGLYVQPPSYRELRDSSGTVLPNVKAQKSIHFVLSSDYSFKMWNRPFKFVSEAYYKILNDVNPYTLDNVRIRYAADNNAVAYAQGLDLRLNGEFVPGTESWFSFGYLKTEENIDNKGFISRPTDQTLKFGILFQDYMPNLRRADVGFFKVFTDNNKNLPEGHWLKKFKDLSAGLEIFNLFNNLNAITNTWVRDVYTKNQYGIPNFMTTRVFNFKISAKF